MVVPVHRRLLDRLDHLWSLTWDADQIAAHIRQDAPPPSSNGSAPGRRPIPWTGSLAWARGLARAGVLSTADASAIDRGLQAILDRGLTDPSFVNEAHGDEDVHAFVERELVALFRR